MFQRGIGLFARITHTNHHYQTCTLQGESIFVVTVGDGCAYTVSDEVFCQSRALLIINATSNSHSYTQNRGNADMITLATSPSLWGQKHKVSVSVCTSQNWGSVHEYESELNFPSYRTLSLFYKILLCVTSSFEVWSGFKSLQFEGFQFKF